jgi:hypothetical protein
MSPSNPSGALYGKSKLCYQCPQVIQVERSTVTLNLFDKLKYGEKKFTDSKFYY